MRQASCIWPPAPETAHLVKDRQGIRGSIFLYGWSRYTVVKAYRMPEGTDGHVVEGGRPQRMDGHVGLAEALVDVQFARHDSTALRAHGNRKRCRFF